jgi:hypothetical protein
VLQGTDNELSLSHAAALYDETRGIGARIAEASDGMRVQSALQQESPILQQDNATAVQALTN